VTGGHGAPRARARLVLGVCVVAGVLLAAAAALEGTLVYSLDPAQLAAHPPASGATVRVSGTVVPGTLVAGGGRARFQLSGGGARLAVRALEAPPGAFRVGQQAVVEGTLAGDGTFVARTVIAKHSNTYRAREPGTTRAAGDRGP
jgi:cytochrome c-type biogenesis protein CcmE